MPENGEGAHHSSFASLYDYLNEGSPMVSQTTQLRKTFQNINGCEQIR
jgi:hypothetical protein